MSFSEILQCDSYDDGVVQLTLNRPDRRNALSSALREDIVRCLAALEADDNVRAVTLTGQGEIFCAGFDLKELGEGDASVIFADARIYHQKVYSFSKPLIAAVNGPAMAGGMDLAFMCDVRLGCSSTQFGQPQVRMGIPAAFDLLRTVLDEGSARYLCLTGNPMDANQSLASGAITELYADPVELRTQALACAAVIAQSNAGTAMKARFLATQAALFDS